MDIPIDSLAYIDTLENTDYINNLIKQQQSQINTSKDNISHLYPNLISNSNLQQPQQTHAIDTSRFSLPTPHDPKDISLWLPCIENAQTQLQQQARRLLNLELLNKYGTESWKLHTVQLQNILDTLKPQLLAISQEINYINQSRRDNQMKASGSLKSLNDKWNDLVIKTIHVEYANTELESRVEVTMTKEQVIAWFTERLNRSPEAYDIYQVAKDFYQLGAYSRALICLQQYVTLPGAVAQGKHLLGYCYLNLGQHERALREFKKCIKENFEEDWQLVVELTMEIEEKKKLL